MKVLVACEFSGTVRDAFTDAGHDAMSCDILPTETPGNHYQGDIRDVLNIPGWDILIAHPPCTYLTNSGVRWLHDPRPKFANRWNDMVDGAEFFRLFLHSKIPRIAVENPVMHGYGYAAVGSRPTQFVQPYEYGHGETKRTGLWLKNLPQLTPTDVVEGRTARVHQMPPGPERQKERSRFFPGIANAMAAQWGGI
jgi:hypothetical protein